MNAQGLAENTTEPDWYSGIIYGNIGYLFNEVHEYDRALAYCEKALEEFRGHEEESYYVRNIASVRTCKAWLELDARHDIEAARREYVQIESQRGKGCWDTVNDQEQIMLRLRIAVEEHDLEQTMKYYHVYMDGQKDIKVNADTVDYVHYLMDLMISLKQYDACEEIIDYIDRQLDTNIPGILMRIYDEELRYYRVIGNMEKVKEMSLLYYEVGCRRVNQEDRSAVIAVEGLLSRAQLRKENSRLQKEAETDQLTRLPNRYLLNNYAEDAFARCYNAGKNFAFEILDVDFFKEYNDTYGHAQGDRCLQKVAGVLMEIARTELHMFVARYGGDEMVIVYEDMSTERMVEIMKRIHDMVADLHLAHQASKAGDYVTVSQGMFAKIPSGQNHLWDYSVRADRALYYVKNNHRGSWNLIDYNTDQSDSDAGILGWK
jgi:diguanylate cyclase (GGDEF)-like protein